MTEVIEENSARKSRSSPAVAALQRPGTGQLGREHLVGVAGLLELHQPDARHARGVQDAVQRPELLEGHADRAPHVGLLGDVTFDDDHLPAERLDRQHAGDAVADRAGHLVGAVGDPGPAVARRQAAAAEQHHFRVAVAGQPLGHRQADAAEPAGDQVRALVAEYRLSLFDRLRRQDFVAGQPAPRPAQGDRAAGGGAVEFGNHRGGAGGRVDVDQSRLDSRVLHRDDQVGAGERGRVGPQLPVVQDALGAGGGEVERPAAEAQLTGGPGQRDERVQAEGQGVVVEVPQVDDAVEPGAAALEVAQQFQQIADVAGADGGVRARPVPRARPDHGHRVAGAADPVEDVLGAAGTGEHQPGRGLRRGGRGRGLAPHGQVDPLLLREQRDPVELLQGTLRGRFDPGGTRDGSRLDPVVLALEGIGR